MVLVMPVGLKLYGMRFELRRASCNAQLAMRAHAAAAPLPAAPCAPCMRNLASVLAAHAVSVLAAQAVTMRTWLLGDARELVAAGEHVDEAALADV